MLTVAEVRWTKGSSGATEEPDVEEGKVRSLDGVGWASSMRDSLKHVIDHFARVTWELSCTSHLFFIVNYYYYIISIEVATKPFTIPLIIAFEETRLLSIHCIVHTYFLEVVSESK